MNHRAPAPPTTLIDAVAAGEVLALRKEVRLLQLQLAQAQGGRAGGGISGFSSGSGSGGSDAVHLQVGFN